MTLLACIQHLWFLFTLVGVLEAKKYDRRKAKTFFNQAMRMYQTDRNNWKEVKLMFIKAFEADPDYGEARGKYAHVIAAAEKNYVGALPEYIKCIKSIEKSVRPSAEEFRMLNECRVWAGVAHRRTGTVNAGIPYLQHAVKDDPTYLSGHYNLGVSLHEARRYEEALDAYIARFMFHPFSRETTENRQERTYAYTRLAAIAITAQQWETALLAIDYGIRLHNVEHAHLHFMRGIVYLRMNQTKSLINREFMEAAHLNPNNFPPRDIQKNVKTHFKTYALDRKTFSDEFKKNIPLIFSRVNEALSSILVKFFHMQDDNNLAYWNSSSNMLGVIDQFTNQLLREVRIYDPSERNHHSLMTFPPLNTCRLPFTLQQSLTITKAYVKHTFPPQFLSHPQNYDIAQLREQKGKKLIVGFISSDIRQHPVYQVVRGIFEYYDRNKYTVIIYLLAKVGNIVDQVEKWVDKIVDVEYMTNREIIDTMRTDNIEVLVDLNLYTGNSKPRVIAERPAPVIINYCGYPGTSGADFINYLITDPIAVPPSLSMAYSEKIIYLPHTWLLNNHQTVHQKILDPKYLTKVVSRKKYGLPENKFVFANFGQHYKIDIHIFDTWCYIMRKVPKSVLWLIVYSDAESVANLKKEFSARRIDPSKRVVFTKKIPNGEHIAAATLADLFLDTPLYNGGVTSIDTLWAGVPFVTIPGEQHKIVQRMGVSLATALEMPEMITYSYEEYGKRAIKLGRSKKLLKSLTKKLEAKRLTAPLFNSKLTTKHFMAALDIAWNDYINQEESQILYVEASEHNTNTVHNIGSQKVKIGKKSTKHAKRKTHKKKINRRKMKTEL